MAKRRRIVAELLPSADSKLPEARSARPRVAVLVRFGAVLLRVPRYARLAYGLSRDNRLGLGQRGLAVLGAAYVVSPIDAVPGIIPVLGQLDDLAVLLLTLRQALRSSPPEIAEEHLQRAGVTFAAIDADLKAVRPTAVWVALKTGGLLGRAARGLARAGERRARSTFASLGRRFQVGSGKWATRQ